ncbi:hypothetical protein CHKEEEPN_4168 [Methylorubrum podarium]|nr:hypothetical protein CHKEEEPN_4168 [Methylorubrum podarium]
MDAPSPAGSVCVHDSVALRPTSLTTLFRPEVLAYQASRRQWGSVVELRPVSARALSWSAVLAAAIVVTFLCFAQYARKEPVPGYLRPSLGTAKVFVPQVGVVREVRVGEGEVVRKGQPLMTIDTQQVSAGGRDLTQAALDSLSAQRVMLARQIQAEEARAVSERQRLQALIDGLRRESEALEIQARRQEERVALGRGLLHSAAQLAAKGIMADAEHKRRQQDLLAQEGGRDELVQRIAQRQNQLVEARANLEQLPTVHGGRLQNLRNDLSWVEQRVAETEARQAYVVVAPVNGTVATLQAAPGQPAHPSQLQMTIVPEAAGLSAELFVPSRAVGFIAPGQPVRLLYEAYPYQKYGAYGGRVTRVSGTVVRPGETGGPLALTEPAYKVEVALESPYVKVDGQPVALKPDMALRADIVLEKRSIMRWLLGPFLGIRNAIDADPLVRWLREEMPAAAAALMAGVRALPRAILAFIPSRADREPGQAPRRTAER